ncbi:MAG: hypothetical protein NVS1B14_03580 [Vulcanimicrobiaceae bacterium]
MLAENFARRQVDECYLCAGVRAGKAAANPNKVLGRVHDTITRITHARRGHGVRTPARALVERNDIGLCAAETIAPDRDVSRAYRDKIWRLATARLSTPSQNTGSRMKRLKPIPRRNENRVAGNR